MFDLDEEIERMQKMLDRRERMALGVTCTEMIELITRLREAEKDAARYRWLRDAPATSASEPIRHWMWSRPYGANMKYLDDAIDQAMKEKGDE